MNTQPKNKMLIIIIAILLIANIVTLSLLLLNKNSRGSRPDRKAQLTAFLKNDVGFSADQVARYDTISKSHRAKLKSIFDNMSMERENIFKEVASQNFSDSGINIAAKSIAAQQMVFETEMLFHLKDIRNICTPAQRPVFDTGFYKIIAKRGDGRKAK
jgi:capsular polysaccharide biosynthesis protein